MSCSKLSPEQEFFTAIIPRVALMTKKSYCNLVMNYPQMKNKQTDENPNKTKQNLKNP